MKRKRVQQVPRHKQRHLLGPGEGYVTCPIEKARIINEFLNWLEDQQRNVTGVRHGVVFYAPHAIRDTEHSPIGQWVRRNTLKRKKRK